MTLRTKLVLTLVGCTWAVSIVVGTLSYRSTSNALHDEVDRSIRVATETAMGAPAAQGRGPLGRIALPREVDVQLIEPDGEVRFVSADEGIEPTTSDIEAAGAVVRGRSTLRDEEVGGEPVRLSTTSLGDGRGAVMAWRSTEEVERVLAALRTRILLVSVVVAAVAAAVGALVARSVTSRLTRLTSVAEEVAASGDLHADIPREGRDETARLGRAFDDMLAALALSSERQRRLVQDAGHELRTPMTSIRTNLYSLRDVGDLDPAAAREVVDDLELEAAELSRLVEDVLAVAGGVEVQEDPELVELVELVRGEANRVATRWGRTIVVRGDGPLEAACRRSQVARAARNLVDNACKFSSPDTPVEVSVVAAPDREGRRGVSIEVSDDGPGIEPDELGLVFERFHRADSARSLPGSGLGLSIVAEVAERHGGFVWARNLAPPADANEVAASERSGAAVGMWIPAAAPQH